MKHRFWPWAVMLGLPLWGADAPVPGRDPQKLQVLILTGYNMHDWRTITTALREMLERTGRFEVRVSEEPAGSDDVTFRGYDVLVLNYTNYKGIFGPTWPTETRQAFLRFLRSGKGVVAYHPACGAFEEWPEYDKVLGGTWRENGAHAPYHTFQVEFKDREHPVTEGLPKSFPQTDELYHGLTMQPGIHVLASAFDDPNNCTDKEPPTCGSGKMEPVIWTNRYGNGRVFHTILGHDMTSISSPGFISTFQRGAEWAASGKVTIAASPEFTRSEKSP